MLLKSLLQKTLILISPLLVGIITVGSKTNHINAFWDFLPTAFDLPNTKLPDNSDVISFLSINLEKATGIESVFVKLVDNKDYTTVSLN